MAVVYTQPQIISIYRKVVFSTVVSGADIVLGEIPVGANIITARTVVKTAFDSTGTDLWSVGISPGGLEIVTFLDVAIVAATDHIENAVALNPLAAERTIYGRYTGSGTAPTTGELHYFMLASLQ